MMPLNGASFEMIVVIGITVIIVVGWLIKVSAEVTKDVFYTDREDGSAE